MALDCGVHLGSAADGPIHLSKEARDVHLHVVGLSRQGKSYFLEHLIRQDIQAGAGVCVIDPHGEMYDHLVAWLAANSMHRKRRIHLINPAMGEWSVGFNPLCRGEADPATRVGAMIDACQAVWQDAESGGHKTLARLLDMVFMTLAHKRLSLREANLLTTLQNRHIRQQIVSEIGDDDLATEWAELDRLREPDFAQRFEAVHNRLREMNRTPGVQSMLGQTENVLDFKTCMDHGHVVLVNLAHQGRMKPQVAQLLGALITSDLYYSAQSRNVEQAKETPFYCYIDECGRYVNEAIVHGLDETAKFGLHFVLSHQRLSQLGTGKRDDPIRNGVVAGAQSKVVFLQEDQDTTSELGDLLFGKTYDMERPKKILIKPAVVGYTREWFESESEAQGATTGEATGRATGTGLSLGIAESLADFDEAIPTNISSENSSEFASESASTSHSSSRVRSRGQSEALVPILEDLPGGVYSLEELKHLAAVEIRLLEKRQALAYRADDRQAIQFVTADIEQAFPMAAQVDDFFAVVRGREPSCHLSSDIEARVCARRAQLLGDDSEDKKPSFWEG